MSKFDKTQQSERSFLKKESKRMAFQRWMLELAGFKQLARVKANEEEPEENVTESVEEALDNDIESHPLFADRQDYDGDDPHLSRNPKQNNSLSVRSAINNAKNELQLRLQHLNEIKLGAQPKPSSAPKPRFPS